MTRPIAYYNENDAEAAAWILENIKLGLIAPGVVDTRCITEVRPNDLVGFTQHHFFAGIGGWSYAARLAGWPDDRAIWTASCPCQPFSAAGKGLGTDDPRHLWPYLFRLWRAFRPACGVGEQVAGAPGYRWFDGVSADLARENYASRVVDIPALAVDAPHQRNRLYWVSLANDEGERERISDLARVSDARQWSWSHPTCDAERDRGAPANDCILDHGERPRLEGHRGDGDYGQRRSEADRSAPASNGFGRNGSWWAGADWIDCHDGKARRVADASAPLLVDGFPNRILAWRGFGNAIVPPLGAEVIGALRDILDASPKDMAA